jgi:tRNA(Ile)-lysidine synthase
MSRPSLTTLVRRAFTGECAPPPRSRILLAVSGGPDSLALMHVASLLGARLGHTFIAHGVDHGLRVEAARELALAAALAERCGIPFSTTRVAVAPGGNLQARAREARYGALRAAAHDAQATFVCTAHHADDRAETVLLRLLRGAGPRGLAVLPPIAPWAFSGAGDAPGASPRESPRLLRPLIRARRQDVLLHLERHAIDAAHDPSNRDTRYLRARVRAELLPLLEDMSPGIVGHLNFLADRLAQPGASWGVDAEAALPPGVELRSLPRATQLALAALPFKGAHAQVLLPGPRPPKKLRADSAPAETRKNIAVKRKPQP